MFFKPKFCCNCGEKVDRPTWTLNTSRRFCELCETEFALEERLSFATVVVAVGFGLLGVGGYFDAGGVSADAGRDSASGASVVVGRNTADSAREKSREQAEAVPGAPKRRDAEGGPSPKRIECGAVTKKGRACTRRVPQTGIRCWQHR
jgi:hypothetical protein